MADASTLIKHPSENMGAFNKRLAKACQDFEVTNVSLHTIDGQPVVTLFSEILEATDEDVAEAKDEDPESDLKVGDEMPEHPPVFVQVARIDALNDEDAAKSQARMEVLYNRADGQVVKLLKDTGTLYGPKAIPNQKTETYGGEAITYLAVVAYIPDDEEDGDDDSMEADLRGSAAV